MIVLALETATRAGSVALLVDGRLVTGAGDPARTPAERLPHELLALVTDEGMTLDAVDRLAVVIGPGSFTGLRVGIAAMQGLAIATGRSVVPVPTFDAMIEAWSAGRAESTRPPGLIAACLDGQRGEVFAAAVGATDQSGGWASVLDPMVGGPELIARALADAAGTAPVTLIALGVERHAAVWDRLPRTTRVAPPGTLAAAAGRLAASRADAGVSPHTLRPLYVRRPDAEIARARQRARHQQPDGWRVEQATVEDRAAIEGIERQTFGRAWTSGALGRGLGTHDATRLFLLRSASGDVGAYCAYWVVAGELHIHDLAVADRWRRRGLATHLLRAVCREAAAGGAERATLEVRESNRAAQALYERLGFRVEGVRRDYYDAPREDAVILWNRALSQVASERV
ncbi:MAG TPA: tRNA (adenosine(37)-N6)-threonylcarbamoyltransferase complex dimerization subunit type 1 TsaB [Vicinamibacterales bacterium]|nr:tRNA (adenosine(37)-N6)-threonylcarbamoyltransferase complex dimerization subunit type 1 TsaB [Vicinamibacterales bacterium]